MKKLSPFSAVILAGGLGTRLRAAVSDVPKPMAPINGIPFLEYQIRYLIKQGIDRVVISTGYKGEIISNYFGGQFCGVPIQYVHEDSPLGTGGALNKVVNNANCGDKDYFLLVNGDTWFEANLQELMEIVERLKKPITMALKYMDVNDRYGGVIADGDIVKRFTEEKNNCSLINAGWYILNKTYLQAHLNKFPAKFSFEADLLRPLALEGAVAAVIQNNKFLDIGVPEDYFRAASVIEL